MSGGLYVSIARAERLIGNIERLTARMHTGSPRRAMMLANAARHRAKLDALLARLPDDERARRERIRTLAEATYMTKHFTSAPGCDPARGGRIEIYDRHYRRVGTLDASEESALTTALIEIGRIQEGRWAFYTGGASREPGLALWWRSDDE